MNLCRGRSPTLLKLICTRHHCPLHRTHRQIDARSLQIDLRRPPIGGTKLRRLRKQQAMNQILNPIHLHATLPDLADLLSPRRPPPRPPLRVLARHLHVEKQHLLREPKDLPHLRVPASRHLHTDIRRLHLPHENQRRLRLGLQQPLGLAARHHAALPPRFPKHPGSFNQTRRRAPRQEAFISPKVTSRRMKSTSTWKITPNFRGRYATMWRRRQQSG
mmetsp:Transcript_28590/g.68179  ORF Transcript_28590/g.68179 Transcript_28590/m.68179 type:complete len:218 (-) Transcript_28590:1025-1678(-)